MLHVAFWTIFGLFITLSVMLTLLVLVQRGKGGGLTGAMGSANTVLGPQAPKMVTWFTAATFGLFAVLAITLNLLANAR